MVRPAFEAGYCCARRAAIDRQLALSLSDRGARAQPADCEHERRAAAIHQAGHERLRNHRQPDFGAIRLVRKFECLRHHADDREPCAVEGDPAADDCRIGGKPAPPQPLRQDRHRRGAFHVVIRFEQSPGQRCDAEHLVEVGGDERRVEPVGVAGSGERHRTGGVAGDLLDAGRLFAEVDEIRIGQRHIGVRGAAAVDRDEPRRLRERQWLQRHGVDDAEDRGVDADPETEDDDDERRERRRFDEHSTGQTKVLKHGYSRLS